MPAIVIVTVRGRLGGKQMMAGLVFSRRVPLEFHDFLRLQTLGAFRNNEFDLVAFAE